jgi:hypothetical protein
MERHVMLDLETFGTAPGSVIRSIGAVVFNPHDGRLGDEFYCNVDEKSCTDLGLTKDPDTVAWWEKNSKEARDSLLVDPLDVKIANERFCNFFKKAEGVYLWSQGANFDEPLYAWVLRATGHRQPWKFHNARDTRTAYHMAGFNPFTVKRAGTYHNALDDAKHQVVCVARAYAKMNGAR